MEKNGESFIDKGLNVFYSKDKTGIYLLIITFFGLIFRLINSYTKGVGGDAAHFVINAKNFLDSGLLVTWGQSTFLWHALTDIFYKAFGVTQFASRFASVLFGTLTILAIYLFVKEFSGNKRIALISAFIFAFAPTFIFNAADEMDMTVLFFIMFSFYYLIKGLKRENKIHLLLSAVLFGLAAMVKAYVAALLIPYVGFVLYYALTKRFNLRKNLKTLIWIVIIIGALVSPFYVYDYLNYKHNGIATFMTTKFILSDSEKADALYGWAAGGSIKKENTMFQRLFISHLYGTPGQDTFGSEFYVGFTQSLYSNGPILLGFFVIGILFMFVRRKKEQFAKDYLVFYLLYFPIPFIILIDGNLLFKHYFHFFAFAIPFIAYLGNYVYIHSKDKFDVIKNKNFGFYLLAVLVLFVFFVVLSVPFNKSELLYSRNVEGRFLEFKENNIPENSLIIYDDRIYNSLAGWIFNDRYYVTASGTGQFFDINSESPNRQNIPVFIVECVRDDCGWGTIKDNQPLNQSMEDFFDIVKDQSSVVHTTKEKIYPPVDGVIYYNFFVSDFETKDYLRVYETIMEVDLDLARQVKMQYNYFLYPSGYENKNQAPFRNFVYTPVGLFEVTLNKFAWFIFYLEIILSFITIPWIIIETYLYI